MTRARRWISGVAAALLMAACADGARGSANPLSPVHAEAGRPGVSADVQEFGTFPTVDQVPPEQRFARIYRHSERISWNGNTAQGYASMEYFGNVGEQTLMISVLHAYSTVGTVQSRRSVQDFLPATRVMGNPLQFTVPEDCGQTANFRATHTAKTILLWNSSLSTFGSDVLTGHASAAQPDCTPPVTCSPDDPPDYMTDEGSPAPGGDPELSPYNVTYNPYDPGYESTSSECSGGGGTSTPPGDSSPTFAEMCSDLGGKLYYDYGCVEMWNPETSQWDPVWCGTFAVCES